MFAFVVILTLILLARAFRSIVLAIKAALLNLVSLAAAFGIVVFVFQQGHGSSLWNIDATQSVTAYIPLMIFAFLYGPLDGLRGVHAHAQARGEGAFYKMQTLSQALVELVLASTVAREVAAAAAPNRHDFVIQLGQAEKTRAAAAAAPSLEAELAPEPEGLEPAAQDVPLRVVSLPRPAARPPSGG